MDAAQLPQAAAAAAAAQVGAGLEAQLQQWPNQQQAAQQQAEQQQQAALAQAQQQQHELADQIAAHQAAMEVHLENLQQEHNAMQAQVGAQVMQVEEHHHRESPWAHSPFVHTTLCAVRTSINFRSTSCPCTLGIAWPGSSTEPSMGSVRPPAAGQGKVAKATTMNTLAAATMLSELSLKHDHPELGQYFTGGTSGGRQ